MMNNQAEGFAVKLKALAERLDTCAQVGYSCFRGVRRSVLHHSQQKAGKGGALHNPVGRDSRKLVQSLRMVGWSESGGEHRHIKA